MCDSDGRNIAKTSDNCLITSPMGGVRAGLSQHTELWFVLRDLKRPNAKFPAYQQLSELNIEVFTPMKWTLATHCGKPERRMVPFMPDLLFVHSTRTVLDPIVRKTPTLQYRYFKGGAYCEPMVVPGNDMSRFIVAVNSSADPTYYMPGELTPSMCGRQVRIIGGTLNGYEGVLLKVRGSRTRRLLVDLPNFLTAAIEVDPEYIQFV